MKNLFELEQKIDRIDQVVKVFFTLSAVTLLAVIILIVMTYSPDTHMVGMSFTTHLLQDAFLLLVVVYLIIFARYRYFLRKSTEAIVNQYMDKAFLKEQIDKYTKKVKWNKRKKRLSWGIIILFFIAIFFTSILEIVSDQFVLGTLSTEVTAITLYVVTLLGSTLWLQDHLENKLNTLEAKVHDE